MASYSQALNLLNNFWHEKSKNVRFLDGDRNTAFFHRQAKIRNAQSHISLLKDGDANLSHTEDIESHVLNYFTNIFSATETYEENDLPDQYIPQLVTSEDNDIITAMPLPAEIHKAVFDLGSDSAPGPDGFPGHFYQKF